MCCPMMYHLIDPVQALRVVTMGGVVRISPHALQIVCVLHAKLFPDRHLHVIIIIIMVSKPCTLVQDTVATSRNQKKKKKQASLPTY